MNEPVQFIQNFPSITVIIGNAGNCNHGHVNIDMRTWVVSCMTLWSTPGSTAFVTAFTMYCVL